MNQTDSSDVASNAISSNAISSNAIALSLFASRIEAVCDEMGAVLQRTAFSPNIKDRLDFSCAVFDAKGAFVGWEEMKVNLSVWAFDGKFGGAFARAAQGSVINVHQGGGVVPVCFAGQLLA